MYFYTQYNKLEKLLKYIFLLFEVVFEGLSGVNVNVVVSLLKKQQLFELKNCRMFKYAQFFYFQFMYLQFQLFYDPESVL